MALVTVDLPSLNELRNRWAAFAAVMAALGFDDMCNATEQRWHYDDAGGNWAELVLLEGDRAVLFGFDGEYTHTYFREAATYFEEPETDLLAGAPEWWSSVLPEGVDFWIGFVYGFDGTAWQRAPYDLEDGFVSVGLPAVSQDRLRELTGEFVKGRGVKDEIEYIPDPTALEALSASGPQLTAAELGAVMGPVRSNVDAGVAAARAFA
jgi:hypothetical protein